MVCRSLRLRCRYTANALLRATIDAGVEEAGRRANEQPTGRGKERERERESECGCNCLLIRLNDKSGASVRLKKKKKKKKIQSGHCFFRFSLFPCFLLGGERLLVRAYAEKKEKASNNNNRLFLLLLQIRPVLSSSMVN